MLPFILISIIYIVSLVVVDSAFNRIIFRDNRKKSYDSSEKKDIYDLWEWKVIGILHLIVLPLIIPVVISYGIGGISYILVYVIIFSVIQWDMIFGKFVYDHWLGDTPHIALPVIGWIQMPIQKAIQLRLGIAIVLLIVCMMLKGVPH